MTSTQQKVLSLHKSPTFVVFRKICINLFVRRVSPFRGNTALESFFAFLLFFTIAMQLSIFEFPSTEGLFFQKASYLKGQLTYDTISFCFRQAIF